MVKEKLSIINFKSFDFAQDGEPVKPLLILNCKLSNLSDFMSLAQTWHAMLSPTLRIILRQRHFVI